MKCLIEWEPSDVLSICDKPLLFAWFADFAWQKGLVAERKNVAALLVSREYAGETLLAPTLANPHIQSDSVVETAMVFLKLKRVCTGWQGPAAVDRVLFTLIPGDPVASDIEPLKDLYHRLACDEAMRKIATGPLSDVEDVLRPDGDSGW
ncbi:PTS sugar transporter subunit IIA [Bifidobacterium sp. ESL0745]|uniref:PTS sugar transporter subunit IIA n=1 Tax=Bifidobacterium sp. ESL0745 TaxID=2983226 RepID=UPI0023F9DDB9|nr:PTS sugar transporter subunit IIA [Bifidobacterium sp. ESL0745]MDF7665764.1 PTS sugar transporter subunit IIA [Bifidobacterium sp. ESL0745]